MKATRTVPAQRPANATPVPRRCRSARCNAAQLRRLEQAAALLAQADEIERAQAPSKCQAHRFRVEAARAAWYGIREALLPYGLIEDANGAVASSHVTGFCFDGVAYEHVRGIRNWLMGAIEVARVVPSSDKQAQAQARAAELRQCAARLDDTLQRCLADAVNAARGEA